MRNIWFTIYSSSRDDSKFIGINNYRTVMELLLIPAIQDKLNREKKAQKIMFCLSPELEKDLTDNFKSNYSSRRIVNGGIINLEASSKGIDWNNLSEQGRKDFLIGKWKVLFGNLSDDYFVTDKYEVIKSLDELKDQDWQIRIRPMKKKVKYNKETYSVVIDLSTKRARLTLVRDSDESWALLKDYETWKVLTDANFKSFKQEGDILTFSYSSVFNSLFSTPEIFNLKEIIN
jgi:hypothetical protein